MGAIPNFVSLTNFFGKLVSNVPLFNGRNDPNSDSPAYCLHSKPLVDIAVLRLPTEAGQFEVNALDESLWRPETYTEGIPELNVGDTCHIVGYPEGLTNVVGHGLLPIWKTGHLANDPQFPFSNPLLKFESEDVCIVDATTRPGMSGAPVFVARAGLTNEWMAAGATAVQAVQAGGRLRRPSPLPMSGPWIRKHRLVGIYSGRTSDSSDLGLVWKPTAIHQVLAAALGSGW